MIKRYSILLNFFSIFTSVGSLFQIIFLKSHKISYKDLASALVQVNTDSTVFLQYDLSLTLFDGKSIYNTAFLRQRLAILGLERLYNTTYDENFSNHNLTRFFFFIPIFVLYQICIRDFGR